MIQPPFIDDPRPIGVWLSDSILVETIKQGGSHMNYLKREIFKKEFAEPEKSATISVCGCTREEMRNGCAKCCGGRR